MKIHHLNCGTLCPLCARLVHGKGAWTEPSKMVCHCLLIEQNNQLILVDTGFGLSDIQNPNERLGKSFVNTLKPKLDERETAISHIKALGYSPADVTDIFPTHLDLDHIGGLSDFPDATVHVYQNEIQQILKPTWQDKLRFRSKQFEHQPKWKVYTEATDVWFGVPAIQTSHSHDLNIRMIPLIGHTKGHVGIAIQTNQEKWLLHCGDAYFHHRQLDENPNVPLMIKIFETLVQTTRSDRIKSLNTLRQLKAAHADDIEFFCAHDSVEFERYID